MTLEIIINLDLRIHIMSPSAGVNNQTSNSIILNATGSILDVSGTTSSGFYVAPVRHYTSSASNTDASTTILLCIL